MKRIVNLHITYKSFTLSMANLIMPIENPEKSAEIAMLIMNPLKIKMNQTHMISWWPSKTFKQLLKIIPRIRSNNTSVMPQSIV